MKWILFSALLFTSFQTFACEPRYGKMASKNGLNGVNCGVAYSLYSLYDTLQSAEDMDEEYVKSGINDFMNKLLVTDTPGSDEDFSAISVTGAVTFYGMFDRSEQVYLHIAVKGVTAKQQGEELPYGAFKPLGFSEYTAANGFKKHVMVIEPVSFLPY